MIVMIMVVAMVMIVVVVVMMVMVMRLAEVRLERRLDLRDFDAEARKGLLELRHEDDAHEPLADLGRDVPVTQNVADDRRLARRRAVYMKELFGLRDDLVDVAVVAGGEVAVSQRLALGKLASRVGQRELLLALELVGGARRFELGDEPHHAFSSARARRSAASANRSCEAAKHQRT